MKSGQNWSLVSFETRPVTVSLINTGHGRTRDDGKITLEFTRTATPDHPATIRGTFTNKNPFEYTFRLEDFSLFQNIPSIWSDSGHDDVPSPIREDLLLAPTDNHEIATTVPDWTFADDNRWRLTEDIPIVRGADRPRWFPDHYRLAPDETFQFEYVLLGYHDKEGFPPNRYHFDSEGGWGVIFAVWETDHPGPDEDSRFSDQAPPPLPETRQMAWSHDADATSAVFLIPDVERLPLPAQVTFTLHNHSQNVVSGNPRFWRLWKLVDGEWFHITPTGWLMPLDELSPGGIREFSLTTFHGPPLKCKRTRSVGYLGGGQYAFEIEYGLESETHAALFEVEAPPVSIEPTDDLTVIEDGPEVRVEEHQGDEEESRGTLTVTRSDEAEARLIAEQVMRERNRGLRNTLAFMHDDIDRVSLVSDRRTVSRGARSDGSEGGQFCFQFRGTAYEAVATF